MTSNPKLAIISDMLATGIGGSDAVLKVMLDLFPRTPLYTTVYNSEKMIRLYDNEDLHYSFIQQLPYAKKIYKAYFPLMPLAVELFNLQEYDVIFSSHYSVAKGVIPRPNATHICYCHSPARYIWDMFWTYSDYNQFGPMKRFLIAAVAQYIRMWDVTSSNRVDHFLANSTYTATRIKKFYNRDSEILYPPVETEKFNYKDSEDFYLMAGRLVAYKGFDLGIEAFNKSGKRLIVLGDGVEYEKLRSIAGSNIELKGNVSENDLINYYNRCKGFIFPGKEDFGIVMAEAQAAGKPVIAFRGGGALDIIKENETGLFFNAQTTDDLNKAIDKADSIQWDQKLISDHAKSFDSKVFKEKLYNIIINAKDYNRCN